MLAPEDNPWTHTRTADLQRMWNDGHSATEIAVALGNFCTRSAVLGKVHRLKLTKRRLAFPMPPRVKTPVTEDHRLGQAIRRREKGRRQRARAALRMEAMQPEPLPAPAPVPLECRPCSLLELTSNTCRFPIGHPGEPGFHFCGAQPQVGSYCGYHDKLTHSPPPKRVRRPFIQFRGIPA